MTDPDFSKLGFIDFVPSKASFFKSETWKEKHFVFDNMSHHPNAGNYRMKK